MAQMILQSQLPRRMTGEPWPRALEPIPTGASDSQRGDFVMPFMALTTRTWAGVAALGVMAWWYTQRNKRRNPARRRRR